jgi:Domain of unknown function (DUF4328)
MNETIACPGCEAELVLPILPAGQTVQCPRCQHVFEPAARRARAVAATSISRRRPVDDTPDEQLDQSPTRPPRFRPLTGEWKAPAAMIALALCVVSCGLQLYTTFEKYQLIQLDERVFGPVNNIKARGMGLQLPPLEKDIAEIDRQRDYVDELSIVSTSVHTLTFWPTVVIFLIWFYQASANLRILQAAGVLFAPVKTAFAFFIPFVNFIMPYQIMQEIWRASDPNAVKDMRSWQHVPGGWLVLGWWLTLIAAAISRFLSLIATEENFDSPPQYLFTSLIHLCMMTAGVMLIVIIYQIRQRQRARHAKIYDEAT